MTTTRQSQAAKRNIKNAQTRLKGRSSREHVPAQPEGRARKRPGSTGKGNYYHVEVRPKSEFVSFRTQDVGRKGHIQRVAGKRSSGSWTTAAWLIGKQDAHVRGGRLVADTSAAEKVLAQLGSKPVPIQGDRFRARPRPNVPERAKPTAAQQRARQANIDKAKKRTP